MTADTMFDYVLALMFSGKNEKSQLQAQFLATLNIHLAELMDKENGFRDEPLLMPPVITSLADEIGYHQRILALLPYGIAGTMMAEDDASIANQYKNKYEEMKSQCIVCRFEEVRDEI